MSPVDRAWLEMDQHHNPMILAGLLEFTGVRDVEVLRDTIATRLLQYPRFRQRALDDGPRAAWIPEAELELAYHLQIHRLSGPDPALALRCAIGREMALDLDHRQPLWRICFYVVRPGLVTLLFRAHHAMADGVALMRLLLQIADPHGHPSASHRTHAGAAPVPLPRRRGPLRHVITRLDQVNELLVGAGEQLRAGLADPPAAVAKLRSAAGIAANVLQVLRLGDDNPPSLRTGLSGQRLVDWGEPLPLTALHRQAQARGVTINDLFLNALAGALGNCMRRQGPLPEQQNLRVAIPVTLRTEQDGDFGNSFGLVLLDLPIGMTDAEQRLLKVHQEMKRLKHSGQARALLISLALASKLPVALETRLVNLVSGKAAAVVSNLPGPEEVLHFGGARLSKAVFWPPQAGNVGLGISLLSYAGKLSFGISCDAAVLPNPHSVIQAFEQELMTLPHRKARAAASN